MLAVGPLGPQYSLLFAWNELGRHAHLGVDTHLSMRVPQKILKKSVSLYYIDAEGLNDVSSIFEASNEVAIDEELKESTSTNEMARISNNDAESSSESVTMNTATAVNTAQTEQVNTPDAVEHTTENKDDWKDDKIEVMEEILVDGESTKNVPRNKEAFKNILNDGSDVHTH